MATTKNDYASGVKPMPVAQGSELLCAVLEAVIPAQVVVNDILVMGFIPEDHAVEDYIIEADDLDSGTGVIAFSIGVLNAAQTDIDTTARGGGAAWAAAVAVAQGGTLARALTNAHNKTLPSPTDRKAIGIKWTTAANVFAAGSVRWHLYYRAASYGK